MDPREAAESIGNSHWVGDSPPQFSRTLGRPNACINLTVD